MNSTRITLRSPLVIAAVFLVAGVAWIFVTDAIAMRWFADPRVQTVKGVVFVLGTAALLWGLLRIDRRREERARERLRDSELRFRALIENTHEIVSILDDEAEPVFRSRGFTRVLGYRPDEVGSVFELIHPEDVAAARETFARAMEHAPETAGPVEFRIRHKEGGWRLLEGTAMNLSHIPAIGGVVVNARDITERRAAEISREAAEARFRVMVEHAHEGIWAVDAEGRTTYVNEKMAEMLATEPEAIVGRRAGEFMPPERRDEYEERLERRRRGEGDTTESELVRADGERIRVQISAAPIYDEAGEFVGSIAMIIDVSERHEYEERLREKGRMEAVGRLAGGIAHDFNNLLTAIRGHADILRDDLAEDDPCGESAEEIARAAERAAVLTDQLLAFGRRQMLEPRVLDLAAVVGDAEPVLRNVLRENVALEIELSDDLPAVRIDPKRIQDVLVHLVVNAQEAMPDGGRVEVELERVHPESARRIQAEFTLPADEYVAITVRDFGTGMSEEVRRHAFEPFFTTKPPGESSGLGLSTVYGLVKQSGGYVWVDDDGRNVGTTIRILLPAAEVDADREPGPPARSEGPDEASNETRVVLVVEDEVAVRRLARTVLEGAGFRVIEAESGRDAIEAVGGRRRPVDLVVTDVVMPSMGGEELADRLREQWPGLRVLFMSGYTDQSVAERVETRPENAFLAKPFTPAELIARVRAMTEARVSEG